MFLQGQDYIMVSGKFPRLTASDAISKLREIITWIVSLAKGGRSGGGSSTLGSRSRSILSCGRWQRFAGRRRRVRIARRRHRSGGEQQGHHLRPDQPAGRRDGKAHAPELQGEELFERVKEAKLNGLKALMYRELIIQTSRRRAVLFPTLTPTSASATSSATSTAAIASRSCRTMFERGVTMQKYREEISDNAIVGYMRNKNVVQSCSCRPTRSSSTTSRI